MSKTIFFCKVAQGRFLYQINHFTINGAKKKNLKVQTAEVLYTFLFYYKSNSVHHGLDTPFKTRDNF